MALNYVTLVIDLADGQGNFLTQGVASFVPTTYLTDATDQIIAGLTPVTASFYAGSTPPSVKLLATDNAGIVPSGWAWTITPPLACGIPAFSFFLPFSGGPTQHLSALAPVSSGATFQAYLPLPSGAPISGQVPVATGSGEISAWGNVVQLDGTASDITQAGTALAAGGTGKAADAGHVHPFPGRLPADGGLIAWTYDPVLGINNTVIAGGVMYLAKVFLRQAQTISNLWVYLSTGVSGATAGQNFLLLYNAAGTTLLGNTASTAIDSKITSNGFVSQAMASPYAAAAGAYWIGLLIGGAPSAGAVARATGNSLLGPNLGLAASSSAWYAANGTTGLNSSTPPASVASFSSTSATTMCAGCS